MAGSKEMQMVVLKAAWRDETMAVCLDFDLVVCLGFDLVVCSVG